MSSSFARPAENPSTGFFWRSEDWKKTMWIELRNQWRVTHPWVASLGAEKLELPPFLDLYFLRSTVDHGIWSLERKKSSQETRSVCWSRDNWCHKSRSWRKRQHCFFFPRQQRKERWLTFERRRLLFPSKPQTILDDCCYRCMIETTWVSGMIDKVQLRRKWVSHVQPIDESETCQEKESSEWDTHQLWIKEVSDINRWLCLLLDKTPFLLPWTSNSSFFWLDSWFLPPFHLFWSKLIRVLVGLLQQQDFLHRFCLSSRFIPSSRIIKVFSLSVTTNTPLSKISTFVQRNVPD